MVPKIQFLLRKEIGDLLNFSISAAEASFQNEVPLRRILGELYPYYDERKELPLTAWGYLINEENPKDLIFWPPSIEYFQQFTQILSKLCYIGQFKKLEKQVNGRKKVDYICKKIAPIKPTHQLSDHPAPGEE